MTVTTNQACSRCATLADIGNMSKSQAIRELVIVPSHYHDYADCIRHLAGCVGAMQHKAVEHHSL